MSTTTTPSQTAEIRRLLSTLSLSPSSVLELPQPTCASHSPSAVRTMRAAFKRKLMLVHSDRSADPHAAAAYAILRAAYDAARFDNGDTAEGGSADSHNNGDDGSTAAAAAAEPEKRTLKPPASPPPPPPPPPPQPSPLAATAAAPATPSQAAEIRRLVSHPSLPSFTVLELPQQTCKSQSPRAVRAVRAAFHSKSRLIHPDRCADPNAGAAFAVLRNAYNAVCAGDDLYNMPLGGGGGGGGGGFNAPRTAAAAAGAAARGSSVEESFSAFYDRCTREADRQMAEAAAAEEAAEAEGRRTGTGGSTTRRKKTPKPKTTVRPEVPPRAESFEEMYDRCTRAAENFVSKEQREARRRRKQEKQARRDER
ncbi:hypothetical protein HDU87_005860 [Geranomyces variabilis]|uniref:J domain-containing protein n=1 Tax=Geranomyces variabilis TaxID=109894 RepID=A0AAD5TG70_9FUNG|nr:hypothetical protein HDU87_005860 [Geranomyces variabilis]